MAQRQAVDGLVAVIERAVVLGLEGHRHDLAVDVEGQAIVVGLDFQFAVIVVDGEGAVVIDPPCQRRQYLVDLARQVAPAIGFLRVDDQPCGDIARQGAGDVRAALHGAKTAHGGGQLCAKAPLRLFGHHVQAAAGLTCAVQGRPRPFQHFDPFDIGKRAPIAVLRGAVELAIAQKAHGLASDHVVVGKAVAATHDRLHTAHVFNRLVHRQGALVVQHLFGHHDDRSGQVADGGVGLAADLCLALQAAWPCSSALDGDAWQ